MSALTVTILSEGKVVDPTFELLSVEVKTEVNRIPYAELVYADGDIATAQFTVSDSKVFLPGNKIEIKLRYEDGKEPEKTIFQGIVVSQAINVGSGASTLSIILKNPAVAMTKGNYYRIYKDKSDDQIIKDLINNAGMNAGTIPKTETVHKEMVQYGCSNWDFMVARAESNGMLIVLEEKKINARLITDLSPNGSASKATFKYGIDQLYAFDFEANGENQYSSMSGASWNINEQKIGRKATKNKAYGITPGNLSSPTVAKKIGGEAYDLTTSATLTDQELNAWAEGKLARCQLGFIRGCISCEGRSNIALLDYINLQGMGDRFSGPAVVTGIGHRVTAGNWITDFQIGFSEHWLLADKNVGNLPASGLLPGITGLQIGIVSGFEQDPDKSFRIRVNIPVIAGESGKPIWARLAVPDAGNERGYYFRPEPGDEVLVGFLNGDPRQAIVLGSLYSPKNKPPKRFGTPDKNNVLKGIVTKKGLIFGFDDKKSSIFIETPGKNTIQLDDEGKKIELKDQHGNSIVMDANGITLKSAKDIKLDASGNIEIKGTKVDIK